MIPCSKPSGSIPASTTPSSRPIARSKSGCAGSSKSGKIISSDGGGPVKAIPKDPEKVALKRTVARSRIVAGMSPAFVAASSSAWAIEVTAFSNG